MSVAYIIYKISSFTQPLLIIMNYQKKNKEIAITIDETPKSFTVNENQKKNKQIAITID